MSMQLALRGVEGARLTGEPQSSFFSTLFCACSKFLIKFKENQFLNSVGYGNEQVCKIKYHGDLVLNNYIKITLPSLFTPTHGWCYPEPSTRFTPTIYLLDASNKVLQSLIPRDVTLYYNTIQRFWIPRGVQFDVSQLRFSLPIVPGCVAVGFTSVDHALFWGFKKYDSFNDVYYIYRRLTPDFSIDNSGWVNSYMKYFRQYKDNVCAELIERVDLVVGGQLIESMTSEYFALYKNLFVPKHLEQSLNILEGGKSAPFFNEITYYMYLPFSLTSIPLYALTRQDVEVRVKFRKFTDLLDPRFLNNVQTTVPDTTAEKVIYDGDAVYTLHSSWYDGILPRTALLAQSNIFVLSSTSQSLACINPTQNTATLFDLSQLSLPKPSVGFVSYLGAYYNFTANGTMQKMGSHELQFNRPIRTVYLFGDVLFMTNGTETFIGTFTGQVIEVYPYYGAPTSYVVYQNALYFIAQKTLYVYVSPTITVYKTSVENVYIDGQGQLVTDTTYSFIGNAGQNLLITDSDGQTSISLVTNIGTRTSLNVGQLRFVYGDPSGIVYCVNTSNQLYSIDKSTPTLISTSCLFLSHTAFISTTYTIYTLTGAPVVYDRLRPIYANTLTYDGQYIYIPPSNGESTLIVYNIRESFTNPSSYKIIRYPNLRVTSSTVDEYRLFMTSSANTLITYTNGSFSELDYVDATDGTQNYINEKVVDMISINQSLYMFSSNGIYRYKTSFTGTSNVQYTLPHSNTLCAFSSPIDQCVYLVSSRPSIDGHLRLFSNGVSQKVQLQGAPPTDVYSSYAFQGSNVVLCGSNLLSISMSEPTLWNRTVLNYSSSNTIIQAGANVYIFPRSQTYAYGTVSDIPPLPLPKPTSMVYDGSKFIYLTDGTSKLVRLNMTFDTFTDASGYDTYGESGLLRAPWEKYLSNIISFSSPITRWNTLTRSVVQTDSVPDTIVCASYIDNNVYAYASASNVYTSVGNVISVSGVNSLHISTMNLAYMTSTGYYVTDRTKDILGTGNYFSVSHPFTITRPNVVAHFDSNIYFMSKNVVSYSYTDNTWSNIDTHFTTDVYTKTYEYQSNLYFLPTTGNILFSVRGGIQANQTLTNSNISGAYGYNGIVYLSSNTSTNVQYYDTLTNATNTYNIQKKTLGVYGYAKNVYFVSDTSDIITYKTQSRNFTNLNTRALLTSPPTGALGVTSVYGQYVISRNGIHTVSLDDSPFPIPIYDLINPGIYGFKDADGNPVYASPTTETTGNRKFTFSIYVGFLTNGDTLHIKSSEPFECILNNQKVGTISPTSGFNTTYTYTMGATPGVFEDVQIKYNGGIISPITLVRDGLEYTGPTVYIVPTTTLYYRLPFAQVSSGGYMVSVDARFFFTIRGQILRQWTPVSASYLYFKMGVTVYGQTIDFYDNTKTEVERRVLKVFPDATFSWNENQLTVYRVVVGGNPSQTIELLPRDTTIPGGVTVTGIYSTPLYTYVYGTPCVLYVFENATSRVRPIPVEHFGITSIDGISHAEYSTSVSIFIITNGRQKLWRFDETTTLLVELSYTPISTPFSFFRIQNGVCIIDGQTIYSYGINKPYSKPNFTGEAVLQTVYDVATGRALIFTAAKVYTSTFRKTSDIKTLQGATQILSGQSNFKHAGVYGDSVVFRYNNTVYAYDFDGNSLNIPDIPTFSGTSIGSGYIDATTSFIPGSQFLYLFKDTLYESYKSAPYGGALIDKTSTDGASNIFLHSQTVRAYDMSTDTMTTLGTYLDTILFYISEGYAISSSNVYFQTGTWQHSTNGTVLDAYKVRKYIVISQPLQVIHFDTETYEMIYHPFTVTCSTSGNVYVNSSNITVYDSSVYSRILVPVPNSKGIRELDGQFYYFSDSQMYPSGKAPSTGSTALKTLFDGEKLYYVYARNSAIDIYDINGALAYTIPNCTPTHVSLDQPYIFASNTTTLYRLTLTTGALSINTEGLSGIDASIGVNGNVYMHTQIQSIIQFNKTNDPYVEYQAPEAVSVLGYGNSNLYVQAGSNIYTYTSLQNYSKTTLPFSSYVSRFENYFVSDTRSNTLVSFDGTSTPIESFGNVVVRDVQNSLFFVRGAHVWKYTTFPKTTVDMFSNIIHFTNHTSVNGLVFDGQTIYTITSDGIYSIDTQVYSDLEYILPSTLIVSPQEFSTGYFDGRYVICIGNGSSFQYDALPFDYPIFVSPSILTEYAYIDPSVPKKSEFTFLVRQVQRAELSESNTYYRVDFLNMLRELIVYPSNGTGTVQSLEMYLNGHLNVSVTGDYMRNQLMLTHTKIPTTNIYTYSFCTSPELNDPTGHLNASRIRDKTLRLQWSGADTVSVYGITYNVFTIKHGLAGLVFNSSTRVDV